MDAIWVDSSSLQYRHEEAGPEASFALDVATRDMHWMRARFQSKGGTVASTITISRGRIAFGEGFSWSSGNRAGSTLTVLGVK